MLTLIHNNRCSKSREALALLEQQGVPVTVRHYLQDPLSRDELSALLQQLGYTARQLLRTKEEAYVALGLADLNLTDAQLIDAMLAEPKLIERPILTNGSNAVVGRPPEQVLSLL